jgi:hypothetical protein
MPGAQMRRRPLLNLCGVGNSHHCAAAQQLPLLVRCKPQDSFAYGHDSARRVLEGADGASSPLESVPSTMLPAVGSVVWFI